MAVIEAIETIDAEVMAAFLDESDESLAAVDQGFVTLESQPEDTDTLNAIFRAIHTIKGNSAFFGLLRVKRLAHQMEDLLALMRDKKVPPGHGEISCLLAGLDLLKDMLRRVRGGQPELESSLDASFEEILSNLRAAASSQAMAQPAWKNVWKQLQELAERTATTELAPAVETLRTTLQALVAPENQPLLTRAPAPPLPPLAVLESVLRPSFDELLPPERAALVLPALQALQAAAEGRAEAVVAQAISEYQSMVETVGFVPLLRDILLERLAELQALTSGTAAAAGGAAAGAVGGGAAAAAAPASGARARSVSRDKADSGRTMRVDEQRIDEFLDYVGELIITREMLGNVGKRLRISRDNALLSTEFQRAMGAFTQLSHNLQRSIMEVRKVPVKLVLQKVPRIVRDVAEHAGKQVQATMSGGEITVDKSLIESFEAPLVHMVRNAVDHGIESPEERAQKGKPALGHVDVSVTETTDAIICTISDDGGGINVQKLKARAVQLGVLGERAAALLSEREAFQLIFAAGLSTAAKVTDVSGRGVGMDVVKRNVTELGGRIDIESELGKGSRFTVHLPKAVTVQILDGFLVQVGNERLVLPLRAINESFRPTRDQLHTVAERGECVSRRGRVFPLVRFNQLLALDGENRDASDAIVVSVQVAGGRSAGLLVDQVLGVQQVVLREVEGIDTRAQVFAGGAVLGDGRVAMVIDVEKLGALVA